MSRIHFLIKFGKKEHLESLMHEGIIRFSPIESFNISMEKERGDELEGAFNVINGQFSTVHYKHPTIGEGTLKVAPNTMGRIIQFNVDPYCCFSSYAISDNLFKENEYHKINKKILECEDWKYALVINNPKVFINKMTQELKKANIKYYMDLVKYVDLKREGDIDTGFFTKPIEFLNQNEFRVLIKVEMNEPKEIKIGGFQDFCFLGKSDEIIKYPFTAT